jgi:hypothetical protein
MIDRFELASHQVNQLHNLLGFIARIHQFFSRIPKLFQILLISATIKRVVWNYSVSEGIKGDIAFDSDGWLRHGVEDVGSKRSGLLVMNMPTKGVASCDVAST